MTMSAGWPLVKLVALFHPSTRLLTVSTTYRWFGVLPRSTAIWLGPLRLDALVLLSPLWVRSISPSTLSAILSPLTIVIEAMTQNGDHGDERIDGEAKPEDSSRRFWRGRVLVHLTPRNRAEPARGDMEAL